jgi:ubiquitin carboxyl-terminal hydrolase 25/28
VYACIFISLARANVTAVINQLADLFFNLEYCETAAVTPTIELAKLALVTSRDEEEDEADRGGTDSSNDTDATLVEDGPPRIALAEASPKSPRSPTRSPNSILGKRPRDVDRQPSAMDLDSPIPQSPDVDGYAPLSSQRNSNSPPPLIEESSSRLPEASSSMLLLDNDGDVQMRATPSPNKPPPLPPRKTEKTSDSVMMFGDLFSVGIRYSSTNEAFPRKTARRCRMHGQLHVPNRDRLVEI